MAPRGAPPDFARTVAANHRRMKGWIWAGSGPCLTIAREEVRRIRRNLELVPSAGRPPRPPSSWWILAVLLCPGDTAARAAAWVVDAEPGAIARVRFYVHPRTDLVAALAPWYAAGLQDPLTADVEDFATFHKQFGWDLNNQVYRDAGERP